MKQLEGMEYVCEGCCSKMRMIVFRGKLIIACPDHPAFMIADGEKIEFSTYLGLDQ
jgi:hypothetical protein